MQFKLLFVLTSLIHTSLALALALPALNLSYLFTRQSAPTAPSTTTCADYSQTANYTAIGSNSTIRGAFLQSSPDGTDPTRHILDTAMKRYASLRMLKDVRLNKECGNLTTIALAEVGKNFTRGVVGPFKLRLTKVTFAKEGAASLGRAVEGVNVMLVAVFVGVGLMFL